MFAVQSLRVIAFGICAIGMMLSGAPAVSAAEPSGCEHFKWALDHEKALLAKSTAIDSGASATLEAGEDLALQPQASAKLPQAPSRSPKFPDAHAGYLTFPAPASAGTYRITLAHGAWIDVVQGGHLLQSTDHTGARDCAGLAKSVKFGLTAAPFTVEISSSGRPSVALVVTHD